MNCKDKPYALVFGASVVDIIGFSVDNYSPYDSTPGRIKMSFGGVCRNIAENMARVGVNTKFISILGDDEKGRSMIEHSKVIGYDMSDSLILKNGRTPTYMAVLNENGEMVSAIVDMESTDEMDFEFIDSKGHIIEDSEYTFLDADNPVTLEYILKKFKDKTKFILDPISAAKAEKIKGLIGYFHTIKPNRQEAEVLVGFEINNRDDLIRAGEYFLSLGVKNIFISLDENGVYYTDGKESGTIMAKDVEVKNVTGAGDSFVAGLGYGYMKKSSLKETVRFAIGMSILAISHEDTINSDMCYDKVKEVIDNTQWVEIEY